MRSYSLLLYVSETGFADMCVRRHQITLPRRLRPPLGSGLGSRDSGRGMPRCSGATPQTAVVRAATGVSDELRYINLHDIPPLG